MKICEIILGRGSAVPERLRGEEVRGTRKVEKHWLICTTFSECERKCIGDTG
jgi:hypothetical protein